MKRVWLIALFIILVFVPITALAELNNFVGPTRPAEILRQPGQVISVTTGPLEDYSGLGVYASFWHDRILVRYRSPCGCWRKEWIGADTYETARRPSAGDRLWCDIDPATHDLIGVHDWHRNAYRHPSRHR